MSKFILFSLLWWITGNPLIAFIVILIVIYLLDRRFVGLFPSIGKPLRRRLRTQKLKQDLHLNPHDTSNKLELARLLMENKQYRPALSYLEEVYRRMSDSPEVWFELGRCYLKLGEIELGENWMKKGLQADPRLKYGEPYLRLGEAFLTVDQQKALQYLQQFGEIHSSSSEAYYLLGKLFQQLGDKKKAREAYQQAVDIYRSLPKYKKRSERRWFILSYLKKMVSN